MKNITKTMLSVLVFLSLIQCAPKKATDEWTNLFNGRDLSGWKANENPESFKVVDGNIVANGLRSHLIYLGEDGHADFKNFELSMDVMTYHLANSGLYFHTAWQDEGFLTKGYELQINTSHLGGGGYKEVKKGGSLYSVRNVYQSFAQDSSWYTIHLRVVGKHVQISIDDKMIVDYMEPVHPARFRDFANGQDLLSHGTFGLQGHDPESTVLFKNIKVKRLADELTDNIPVPENDTYPDMMKQQVNHFAFIDTRISTDQSFQLDNLLTEFYRTGINAGLVAKDSMLSDEAAHAFISRYRKYPVFLGLQIDPLKEDEISKDKIAPFDYVTGTIPFATKGMTSKEADAKMDEYVKLVVNTLNKGTLDIWAAPTFMGSPDDAALWTNDRMMKVIDAAKLNNVAIEINEKLKVPSLEFIKLAKEKGCKFSTAGIYGMNQLNEPTYFLAAIDQCKLDYKDIFIPGN